MKNLLALSVFALACAAFPAGIVPAFAKTTVPARAGANEKPDIVISASDFKRSSSFASFLPKDAKGAKIFATDFEQLIAPNGSMRFPLSDKTCLVTVTDKNGGNARTFTVLFSTGNSGAGKPAIVPAIQEWQSKTGDFQIDSGVSLWCDPALKKKNPLLAEHVSNFRKDVFALTGIKLKLAKQKPAGGGRTIVFELGADERLGEEGYELAVSRAGIVVSAVAPVGVNWAAQTLLQGFKNSMGAPGAKPSFPCGNAADYPQYPLRGFSYDVGRKPATIESVANVVRTEAPPRKSKFSR